MTPVENHLTERDLIYQKGLTLINASKYSESAPFFLKITQTPLGESDEIYNLSLWYLSLIFEKQTESEKAILALHELEVRNSKSISLLKIQFSQMKNYLRMGNSKKAEEIRKKIDKRDPVRRYSLNEIYESLQENVNFNYDLLMVQELQFLGEVEKYFIYIMESKNEALSLKSTELLMALYNAFFKAYDNDAFNIKFKTELAQEMLEQLSKFDQYKLNDDSYSIAKFSDYSRKKQKILTDWLHQ